MLEQADYYSLQSIRKADMLGIGFTNRCEDIKETKDHQLLTFSTPICILMLF